MQYRSKRPKRRSKWDADGRGKSKLPYSRIQAISMVAIADLGPRPGPGPGPRPELGRRCGQSPMKLIPLSKAIDSIPLEYAPDASSPLAALTAWVGELESRSGATCLPTREPARGPLHTLRVARGLRADGPDGICGRLSRAVGREPTPQRARSGMSSPDSRRVRDTRDTFARARGRIRTRSVRARSSCRSCSPCEA